MDGEYRKKIGLKTLDQMRQHYGTNPEEVLIGIGPAIGQCCYEVSKDVKKSLIYPLMMI